MLIKNTHLSASDFGPLIDRNYTFVSNFQKKILNFGIKMTFPIHRLSWNWLCSNHCTVGNGSKLATFLKFIKFRQIQDQQNGSSLIRQSIKNWQRLPQGGLSHIDNYLKHLWIKPKCYDNVIIERTAICSVYLIIILNKT